MHTEVANTAPAVDTPLRIGPSRARRRWWRFLSNPLVRPIARASWRLVELWNVRTERRLAARHGWDTPTTPHAMVRATRMFYSGPHVTRDGVEVKPGDVIVEVHLNSRVISSQPHSVRRSNRAREDFEAIALWLLYTEAAAVRVQTTLRKYIEYARFEVHPFNGESEPSLYAWFFQLFAEGYVILYHPCGIGELEKNYAELRDGWMSRAHFIGRFLRTGSGRF